MSKSDNTGVCPHALIDEIGPEAVRYFLARDGGIASDPEYSHEAVLNRYKHDLMGQLGNLRSRCSSKAINPGSCARTFDLKSLDDDLKAIMKQLDSLTSISR